ncbi:MAG: glycosyltransferase family 39 protein [Chloroflexi bacterium]|nr:glycosyltransferase family 39 protein [Chloroflexota bacterium]
MRRQMGWTGLVVITAVFLYIQSPGHVQQATAVILLWVLPAIAWSTILSGDVWVRGVTAVALVMLMHVFVMLLVHYLPGAVSQWVLLLVAVVVAILPIFLPRSPGDKSHRLRISSRGVHASAGVVWLLALLGATILLRLPNMGYKEIQGDEGIILMRAATALLGDDGELFLHQKGPVEILFPMLTWEAAGSITEFWARVPFLIAGVLSVIALMLLARRWFGWQVGLVAGVLYAINGFAIAFSRIIQYQSFVMLWGMLAVFYADWFRQDGKGRDLGLTAVFLAGGLLAHYDAVLVVPAIIWLVWPRLQVAQWKTWVMSALAGVVMLAVFYLPYVRHPNFAKTKEYLLGARLGQTEAETVVRWSGAEVWQMVTFYNSIYFIVGLIVLLLVGLVVLRLERNGRIATLLYFGVPLLFYTVIVDDARTHVYTIFPGLMVLAGVGVVWLWRRVTSPLGQRVLLGVFGLFWAVSAGYVVLVFLDTTPERQRSWADNQPAFYPTTWEEPPLFGLFGFPYQAGWRALSKLPIDLPYASNEEEEITNVYMAQANRTHCTNFETFVLAEGVQDTIPYDPAWLEGLFLQAEVVVNGRTTLQQFGREPVTAVQTIQAVGEQRWLTPQDVAAPQLTGTNLVGIPLGDEQVQLLGYDLDTTHAYPGGNIVLTLYWQSLVPFDRNFQVFTHLYDGELRAQDDSAPECNINPTTRWEPGQIITDPHLIALPAEIPEGEFPLLVGLYDLISKDRLVVPGTDDSTISLGMVEVKRP